MRAVPLAAIAFIALIAAPALAGEPDKPVTDSSVSAVDVVATPASDLNLRKDEIPPLLLAAQAEPYGLAGLGGCPRIASAIGELDGFLGPDIDLPQEGSRGISAGRVAQSVIGSFIPFRGVIRELSGANEHERRMQAAIYAGVARRSFLKGVGIQRGCRYPARPASAQDVVAVADRVATAKAAASEAKAIQRNNRTRRDDSVSFVSKPVVQKAN